MRERRRAGVACIGTAISEKHAVDEVIVSVGPIAIVIGIREERVVEEIGIEIRIEDRSEPGDEGCAVAMAPGLTCEKSGNPGVVLVGTIEEGSGKAAVAGLFAGDALAGEVLPVARTLFARLQTLLDALCALFFSLLTSCRALFGARAERRSIESEGLVCLPPIGLPITCLLVIVPAVILRPFALLRAQVLHLLALLDPQLLAVLRRQPPGLQILTLPVAQVLQFTAVVLNLLCAELLRLLRSVKLLRTILRSVWTLCADLLLALRLCGVT